MIAELQTFIGGDYIAPCNRYKAKKYRTVFFLDDFRLAQFFEINNQLTRDWKAGDSITSQQGDEYCVMNLSLEPFTLLSVFHDEESVTLEQAREAVACKIS